MRRDVRSSVDVVVNWCDDCLYTLYAQLKPGSQVIDFHLIDSHMTDYTQKLLASETTEMITLLDATNSVR